MTPQPESDAGDEVVERRLNQHQRALVDGLDSVLDVEAGLWDVMLQSCHDVAVEDLGELLDAEAGLREALGVRPDTDTVVPLRTALPTTDRRLWSYKEIAAYIGTRTDSVRSYRKNGLLPPPDLVEGGKPYWLADTVRAWLARSAVNRPRRDTND